jgi:hypothetical protein
MIVDAKSWGESLTLHSGLWSSGHGCLVLVRGAQPEGYATEEAKGAAPGLRSWGRGCLVLVRGAQPEGYATGEAKG